MIIKKEIDLNEPLTDEQKRMLKKAEAMPVSFDDDSPELTDEQLKEFHRIAEQNKNSRRKQTVTLRLSPQALEKARSLGKGYTSVLSRMLENALEDNEQIKKAL